MDTRWSRKYSSKPFNDYYYLSILTTFTIHVRVRKPMGKIVYTEIKGQEVFPQYFYIFCKKNLARYV